MVEGVSRQRDAKQPVGRDAAGRETQQRLRKLISQLQNLQGEVAGLRRQAEITQGAVSELRLVEARHEIRAVQRRLDGLEAAIEDVGRRSEVAAERSHGTTSAIEGVERGVAGIGAGFDQLAPRIEALERGLEGVQPKLDALGSDVAGIADIEKALEDRLEGIGSDIASTRREMAGIAERAEASDARVAEAFEAALSRLRDVTAQVEAIAPRVEAIPSQFGQLGSQVAGVDRTTRGLQSQAETSEAALARIVEVRREVRALRRGMNELSGLREDVAALQRAIEGLEAAQHGRGRRALARWVRPAARRLRKGGRRIGRSLRLARRRSGRALRRGRAWMRRGRRRAQQRVLGPQLGRLNHHRPRELRVPRRYFRGSRVSDPPVISIVTPSLNQARFLGKTIETVIDQRYPRLEYIVQDGGSTDETNVIVARHHRKIHHYETRADNGQAQAINLGFRHATGEIMSYLNADDLLLPGTLAYVARYFERHPDVDVIYGHRVLVDENGKEVGRWVLPPHDDGVLSWADFVPQETLYWRRRLWDGAAIQLDEECRFALDWDLLLRFRDAGAKMVRVPRFLGAFRVHETQKTSAQLGSSGEGEMARIRARVQGREVSRDEIRRNLRGYMARHVVLHKLYRAHLLRY